MCLLSRALRKYLATAKERENRKYRLFCGLVLYPDIWRPRILQRFINKTIATANYARIVLLLDIINAKTHYVDGFGIWAE